MHAQTKDTIEKTEAYIETRTKEIIQIKKDNEIMGKYKLFIMLFEFTCAI